MAWRPCFTVHMLLLPLCILDHLIASSTHKRCTEQIYTSAPKDASRRPWVDSCTVVSYIHYPASISCNPFTAHKNLQSHYGSLVQRSILIFSDQRDAGRARSYCPRPTTSLRDRYIICGDQDSKWNVHTGICGSSRGSSSKVCYHYLHILINVLVCRQPYPREAVSQQRSCMDGL